MKAKLMIAILLCVGAAFAQDVAPRHLKVLRSSWVTLSTKDANGYEVGHSRSLQRIVVESLESKGKAKLDMLCYGTVVTDGFDQTTQVNHCPTLEEGKTYIMDVGGRSAERNISGTNRRAVWQILELCIDSEGCQQISTIQDR